MRGGSLAALACVLLAACGEESPAPYVLKMPDAGSSGAPGPGPGPELPDAGPAPVTVMLPELEEAMRVADARATQECADVPGVWGFYTPPSLHVIGERVYVFSVDSSEAVPRVLLHVSELSELSFGEPATLIHGARPVDLVAQGDELRALAGRQFYTVELASTDGTSFEEAQQVGPHEPTYNCEGYPPPRYFRGREPAELIAVGSDYNTGLFGCYERVFVARRDATGAWAEPVEVGRGDAVFAYQGATRATIVTNLGVLQSDDDGESFEPIAGLQAAGGASTGERLVLARATPEGILALESRDDGESWSRQTRVLSEPSYGGAFVAADGATLAMAVASAEEIVLSTSFDQGDSWTEPFRLARPMYQRLLAIAQAGEQTLWLTSGAEDALELCRLR